jgi:chorismate-pyruvate lyase
MTPLIETNWELFDEKENVSLKQMSGWVSEDKSLISRLEKKYGTINLEVLSEEETLYSDKELDFGQVKGNLRKVFLKAQKNVVYAESFFSSKVCKKLPKFKRLGKEPLGKYLFNNPLISKKETYFARYSVENNKYLGRKCIYDLDGEKFFVIEVFLFHE